MDLENKLKEYKKILPTLISFEGNSGKEALPDLFEGISKRFTSPYMEGDLLFLYCRPDIFKDFFLAYYSTFPEKAKEKIDKFNQQFKGVKVLLKPFYLWFYTLDSYKISSAQQILDYYGQKGMYIFSIQDLDV